MSDLVVMNAIENLRAEIKGLTDKVNAVSDTLVEITAEITEIKAKEQAYRPTFRMGTEL